jgi:hypothetical protein
LIADPASRAQAPCPRPRRRAGGRLVPLLAAALGAGCSQSAVVGRLAGDAAVVPFDFDSGPGYVDGHLHAHAVFDSVHTIYWFGGDNDPSRLELYIFENTATCAEVSTPGWVTSVRPTDLMGITVGGTTPGTYTVYPETPPRPGNAFLLHEIDQADPVVDSVGESGSVVITSVKPGVSVTGTLAATFSTGTLDGAFQATWCPTGVGL